MNRNHATQQDKQWDILQALSDARALMKRASESAGRIKAAESASKIKAAKGGGK